MSKVVATINGADQFTDWMAIRGSGRHFFDLEIFGTFTATVTVQIRRADSAEILDLDQFTAPAARTGEKVGSFDVRVGVKTGDYTSGNVYVELND